MIDKIKENWEKILLILKEEHEVSDVSYRTWLQPLTPYSFKGNTVTIIVRELLGSMYGWHRASTCTAILWEDAATNTIRRTRSFLASLHRSLRKAWQKAV